MLGVMPWGFTYHELELMALGRRVDSWDRVAFQRSDFINANRGKNQTAKEPAVFHPWPHFSDLLKTSGVCNPAMWKAVKDKWKQ